MNSAILRAAARYVSPVIFVVSLVLLYRGHNLPGGGFIGGLTAATAILLSDFGKDARGRGKTANELNGLPRPILWMILGLAIAGLSAVIPVVFGEPFFTGLWLPGFSLPLLGKVHLGTPLLFDVGVYLAVIGFVVHAARCLKDETDDFETVLKED
ncbi:MAG: MnhB domain-containing protein [Verrucomicrobiota bacterium]